MQLIIGTTIIVLDQFSKWLLADEAIRNPGLGFGLLADTPIVALLILAFAAGIVGWLATRPTQPFVARLGWAFVLGGLASNLIDRIRLNAVSDVLSVGSWFPTFNLADVSVVVGLGLVLLARKEPALPLGR